MFLSEAFDVNQLLHLLENRRNKFNIRARQASGSLYVLDLDKCYDFLGEFRRSSTVSDTDYLRSFIDHSLVKTGPWHKCVKECDPTRNKIVSLNVPNLVATYRLTGPSSSYLNGTICRAEQAMTSSRSLKVPLNGL